MQRANGLGIFENTMHIHRVGGWTASTVGNAANVAKNWWVTYMVPYVSSLIGLYNVHALCYDPYGFPWVADATVNPPIYGTRPGVMAPGNVTITVSERTSLAGRRNRGRFYWPGISEPDITGDTVVASFLAGEAIAAVQLASVFNDANGNGRLCIFHRRDNAFTDVSNFVFDYTLDSQRNRLAGRGI